MPFSPNAEIIFADGPTGAPKQPYKPDVRAWGSQLEAAADAIASGAGTIAKQTLAQLNADLAHAADTMAWVYADGNATSNGIYRKSGSSGSGAWSFALPLPYSFIVAANAGTGTSSAIRATTSIPVTNGMLVSVPIAVQNATSPVTVTFNNQPPLIVKTRSGQDIADGDLTPGFLLGIRLGTLFYLLSDTAVASLIYAARDAAVTARDAAELARDGAVAALASITNQISAALPMVYTFQVGGDVQSADVENAEVTKHHVLWMALDGVLQNEDTFNVTEGLITPVDGDWPEVTLQVKLGIGMPISIAAAVPLMQSVRNVQVADDAAIEATKLSYTALAAPYVKRSVSEKFREVRSLADYGGKGNGTFDNSAAWADAIDDAMSFPNGGTIYLPAGHYGAGSSISFPKTAGKWLRVVGEGAGTVIDVSGVADHAWYVGGALAAGGTNFRAEQLQFVGQSQTGKTAIRLENANGAQFENIFLDTMNDGFDMTDSYAVSFVGIQTVNVGRYSIYSNTPAHNTIIDRCKAFNAGVANSGCFLWIDGHTDNLVVQNSDFESCRQIFNLADGGSSARFVGNYTEYCVTDPFGFGTGVYGLDMSNNWLSFGAAFEFTKWFGGAFQRNRLFNQNIFWNSTCRDVQTGGNRLSGTSTMQPFPAQAISAFLNGSSVGARPITYFKDQGGFVHLTGELVVGANGSPAFSLPAGYRPIPAGIHPRFSTVSAVDNKSAFLIADSSNGNIVPTCSGNQTITLDGIIFKAE